MKQGGKAGENGPEKIVADIRGDPRYRDRGLKSGADTKRGCVARILSVRSMQMGLAAGLKVVEERRGSRDESTSGKLSHLRVVRTPSPACSTTRREVSSRRIGRKSKQWELIFERIGPTFFSFRTNEYPKFYNCWMYK